MSYCNLSVNTRTAPKVQAPKQLKVDEFERDIKANIEAIQNCARAVAAEAQLDCSNPRLLPGQSSNSMSASHHLSSGRGLAMATERLFRDWAVQWAGEPAERCRKRCAHDKLQRALADAMANLDDASRLVAVAQVEIEKDDLEAFDGAEEETSLLSRGATETEEQPDQRRRSSLLPPWLGDAAMKWGPWKDTQPLAAEGPPLMKGSKLDVSNGDLSDLAAQLLAFQEAAYKLLVLAAVLLVLVLGFRSCMSAGASARSTALQEVPGIESFSLAARDVVALVDGGDSLLPALHDSDDNTTSLHELRQASGEREITALDGFATAQERISIATPISHQPWGATQV